MFYIHLPLFLSCLILTQSIYSMEPFKLSSTEKKPKTKKFRSSSSSSSPNKNMRIPPLNIIDLTPSSSIESPKQQQQQPTSPRSASTGTPISNKSTEQSESIKSAILRKRKSLYNKAAKYGESKHSESNLDTRDQIVTRKSDPAIIINSPKQKGLPLINAVREKNIDLIKIIMNDPMFDVNQQNEFGMTALHVAVLDLINNKNSKSQFTQASEIISLMLKDPRTDSSKENANFLTASQFIQGTENLPENRQALFAHFTLCITSWTETFLMRMRAQIDGRKIDNKYIQETRECIIQKIKKTQKEQEHHQAIPENALFSPYMTNDFIEQMIQIRLFQIEQHKLTNKLIPVLHKEIESLLLNVKIDEEIIKDARENVKKVLISQSEKPSKKSKLFLTLYTDKFLTSVIKSYLLTEKEKFENFLEKEVKLHATPKRPEEIFILSSTGKKK